MATWILTLVFLSPLAGVVLLMLGGEDKRRLQMTALGVSLVTFALTIVAYMQFQQAAEQNAGGFHLQQSVNWIGGPGRARRESKRYRHSLPRRHRRCQHLAAAVDRIPDAAGDLGQFLRHHEACPRVLHLHAAAGSRHARRLLRHGPAALLRLLRVHTDPALFPDRHLGWSPKAPRRFQISSFTPSRAACLPSPASSTSPTTPTRWTTPSRSTFKG